MPTSIITTDDLREFKTELLEDFKSLIELKKNQEKNRYLKSAEVMKLLSISAGTLQTFRINGTIPYSKVGGIIFYKYQDVIDIVDQNKITN
ncbi:helix-turn-helix domain-containing protein [Flavicella sp.]|uniref:helix-turn-helix domain-containing protein n=1 Tax=Flavicella sp. TaxID=2957742 RepID=UPI00262D6B5C|nr:helix-turn-helix domain-containing protein [Flavicella sp.]MDG1805913.1 helix-turn-helix domain-containing protein [Flavicella sp.]